MVSRISDIASQFLKTRLAFLRALELLFYMVVKALVYLLGLICVHLGNLKVVPWIFVWFTSLDLNIFLYYILYIIISIRCWPCSYLNLYIYQLKYLFFLYGIYFYNIKNFHTFGFSDLSVFTYFSRS